MLSPIILTEFLLAPTVPVSYTHLDVYKRQHLNAEINFATKKINVTLKNDSDITAELNDLDFYSSNDITEIGSFYLRAAKSNGTVGLDNLTMVSEDITE